jgi:glutamate 5-kinase
MQPLFVFLIAVGSKPKGKITVDHGAKNALVNKKSLLAVGIVTAEGIFEPGDIVSIVDKQGIEFARGKIAVSARTLEKVKGARFEKEIIHRDNIVVL